MKMDDEHRAYKVKAKIRGKDMYLGEDGAFYSAARVFRELADEVELHAKACDAELEKFMQKGSNK